MPEEIRIQTPHLRFAARRWGDSAGSNVLALHGWLDNAASFDGLAPLLRGIDLVALDLAGHGLTGHRPPGARYHYLDHVADVVEVIDALGWENVSLLGHSLGAGIACLVAAVAPERVRKLALIEGFGPLTAEPEQAPEQLRESIRQTARLPKKRLPHYRDFQEASEARRRAGDLSLEAARILASRGTQADGEGIAWRSDPRLTVRSPAYLTEEQVLAFLSNIQAPTLLVEGLYGYLVSRDFMAARYQRVAHLRVERLPGRHHLHLDDPKPVVDLIQPFLAETPN